MKLSQICRRIELCMREIILRLGWIYEIYFFLDRIIPIRIFMQVPTYNMCLTNWIYYGRVLSSNQFSYNYILNIAFGDIINMQLNFWQKFHNHLLGYTEDGFEIMFQVCFLMNVYHFLGVLSSHCFSSIFLQLSMTLRLILVPSIYCYQHGRWPIKTK
jgi:hypothetical protein